MGWRVGCDVGGTFVDFAISGNGNIHTGKYLSGTIEQVPDIVLKGFNDMVRKFGLSIKDCDQFLYATTIASNLILERKGKGTALITTKGFASVLRITRQKRWDMYDFQLDPPAPLISRRDIFEVSERIYSDGSILTPLDEESVRAVARQLKKKGVNSVAVCLLHSYINPVHEQKIKQILTEETPGMLISLSSEICPTWREYERSSTIVANAYVRKDLIGSLESIEGGLKKAGYKGQLLVMQSAAGLASAEMVKQSPVKTIESGPAAGAVLSSYYSRTLNADICLFDMGGTTTKASLTRAGKAETRADINLDVLGLRPCCGIAVTMPAIDMVEIGAGGGSIVRVSRGTLTVGPESAGAAPGPICYGLGGTDLTITDADLVLNYLDPAYFSGGKMKLDRDAAVRAMEELVAKPLNISVPEAAYGIFHLANLDMENAVRSVTLERGVDPRSFTLLAIGGAAPVRASAIARDLAMKQVCVPGKAGVGSAVGLLLADSKVDFMHTHFLPVEDSSIARINSIFAEMAAEGLRAMKGLGIADFNIIASAEMRYRGQGYELEVPLPKIKFAANESTLLRDLFHKVHFQRYSMSSPEEPVEAVNWHLSVFAPSPRLELKGRQEGSAREAYKGKRKAYFGAQKEYVDCDLYEFSRLPVGSEISGPAIVEDVDTTVVLGRSDRGRIDTMGNLLISVGL